jgi:multidrug efflux pump subunit AcrB
MIATVIRFCLENKLVVALVVIAVIGWGVLVAPFDWDVGALPRNPVPTDAIPDIGENQQIIFTEWMGRSPQDVEDQISYPLTVSLLGVPGVKTIRSYSMFGFSTIYVIFDEGVEFYWSRTRVLEKLNSLPAGTVPEGVTPTLGPDATPLGQVFWYTLEGRDPDGQPAGGWDLHELRTVQDWYVRYSLLSAEGISEVGSIGGFVQEYQIDVDPDAMRAARVGIDDVFMAVRMSNIDVGARTIEIKQGRVHHSRPGLCRDGRRHRGQRRRRQRQRANHDQGRGPRLLGPGASPGGARQRRRRSRGRGRGRPLRLQSLGGHQESQGTNRRDCSGASDQGGRGLPPSDARRGRLLCSSKPTSTRSGMWKSTTTPG